MIFQYVDPALVIETFINDGDVVQLGDVVFHVQEVHNLFLKQSAWF
jgi:nicotinate-nucleotide pyrophosphorylase (carboxylating)